MLLLIWADIDEFFLDSKYLMSTGTNIVKVGDSYFLPVLPGELESCKASRLKLFLFLCKEPCNCVGFGEDVFNSLGATVPQYVDTGTLFLEPCWLQC